MGWSSKTQPTPANIRKRITAAEDAINGALVLIECNHQMDRYNETPLNNAKEWLAEAYRRTKRR